MVVILGCVVCGLDELRSSDKHRTVSLPDIIDIPPLEDQLDLEYFSMLHI